MPTVTDDFITYTNGLGLSGSVAERRRAALTLEAPDIVGSWADQVFFTDTRRRRGELLLPASSRTPKNLFPGNSNLEVNASKWENNNGTGGVNRVADGSAPSGGFCGEFTATGDTHISVRPTADSRLSVIPGKWYTVSAYFKKVSGTSETGTIAIFWLNAAGTMILDNYGSYQTLDATFKRSVAPFKAPAGAVYLIPIPIATNALTGAVVRFDAVMIEEGSYATPTAFVE